MAAEWTTLITVLAVVFLSTVIRSGFGFGIALVAVPLIALVMPVKASVTLVTLVSLTVAAIVLVQDWRKVQLTGALGLVVPAALGIPLGLELLDLVDEKVAKVFLAVCIIVFSLYCLLSHGRLELRNDKLAWAFGFVAGVMGGAFGINGPPLAIYGSLRRWPPERFRATLQGYFFFASILALLGYWRAGYWDDDVTRYYFHSLPVTLLATVMGRWIGRRLHTDAFLVYIHVGLIVVGSILLVQVSAKRNPPTTPGIDVKETSSLKLPARQRTQFTERGKGEPDADREKPPLGIRRKMFDWPIPARYALITSPPTSLGDGG